MNISFLTTLKGKKMTALKKMILFFLFMGINYSSHAMDIIKLLSKCDNSFFKQINQNKQFTMIPDAISPSELFSDNGISIPLQHTTEEGIEIDHFIAIAIDLDRYKTIPSDNISGKFYFWGFETSQAELDVIQRVSTKLPLIEGGGYYVANSMMRNTNEDPWQHNLAPVSGIAPTGNSAEKLFFIEANKENGTVKLMCTLQGNVNDEDLKAIGLIH